MSKLSFAKEKIYSIIEDHKSLKNYRLETERDLAKRLNISRFTVTAALKEFEYSGIVERRRGSGTYIVENRTPKAFSFGIVSAPPYHTADKFINMFFNGLSKHANSKEVRFQVWDGVQLEVEESPQNNRLFKAMDNGMIDGVFVVTRMPVEIMGAIKARTQTVLLNNPATFDWDGFKTISCNHFRSGFIAGEFFHKKGHKRIGYVTPRRFHPDAVFQISGLKSVAETLGINFSDNDVFEYNPKSGIEPLLKYLKENKYTGIMVRDDCIAQSIIEKLKSEGVKVPDDISVMGTGFYSKYGYSTVSPTTVDCQYHKMCDIGLKWMLKKLKGEIKEKRWCDNMILVEPEVVDHGTVADLT